MAWKLITPKDTTLIAPFKKELEEENQTMIVDRLKENKPNVKRIYNIQTFYPSRFLDKKPR